MQKSRINKVSLILQCISDCPVAKMSKWSRKIKETLLIRDLKPALNENVGSEKLLLY